MKDEIIRIRLSSEEKAKIQNMAESKGITVTQYILDRALKSDEAIESKVEGLEINRIGYKGLTVQFKLEPVDGELVIVGRIYKGLSEIKTGFKLIFGRTVADIKRFSDDWGAATVIDSWFKSLAENGGNPYEKYYEV